LRPGWFARTLKPVAATRPRVLVVDDDSRFAFALAALLEAEGFEVVAHAADGAEAVKLAKELRPDVATMDLQMPTMDGIEATRQIAPLGVPVVIVSASEYLAPALAGQAAAAGAVANVPKSDAPRLLGAVLREVLSRE
jgi:two-component system response regulator DesR